jgi:hydroxymethylglutaryl-CoA lyase
VRDGFQHLEKFISTRAKIFYAEEMIFADCQDIRGHQPRQLSDAAVQRRRPGSAHLRSDRFRERCAKKRHQHRRSLHHGVTIRENRVDRAIDCTQEGVGRTPADDGFHRGGTPLRQLGLHPAAVLEECERCIKKCNDAGMKMCAAVSTIWKQPIAGATELKDAVEFTKRWLEIGAADIEHADHDGSASAPQVYRYFSMILDEIPDPRVHIAHYHETKRVASASVLAALQAGITHFEGTLGGMGGQPANFLDDCPVPGTGILL